jgi:hypothetical protein
MVAPLCWEPDLKAVKTAESDFEMDSLISSRLLIQSGVTSRAPIEFWEKPLSEATGAVQVITDRTVMTGVAIIKS